MSLLKRTIGWFSRTNATSRRFGNYHIIKIIHDGEKSAVYQARSAEDDGLYVIKAYKPRYNQVADRLCRRYHLRREGEIGLGFNPPNGTPAPEYPLVRTIGDGHEFGDRGRCYYVIQEFIDGMNLKNLVGRGGELTRAQRFAAALNIARGLQIIHDRGMIHRDVCTDNILLARSGHAKVIDLGFVAPQGLAFREQTGTPSYMAPEQFTADKLYAAADIYSYGVVLYELFTGRLPFTTKFSSDKKEVQIRRTAELMEKHLKTSVPPPKQHAPDIPAPVERLILRCLEKQPEKRYSSMREVIAGLSAVREAAGALHGADR